MNKAIIFASALVMTLSACEMKDEIWGENGAGNGETGTLTVKVKAQEPEAMTRAILPATDFPVTITGIENAQGNNYSYAKASDMPATLRMPVGSYVIEAHTPGDIQREMNAPYYRGSKTVAVTNLYNTETELVCKMANSRIKINFDDAFLATYTDWDILISAGNNQILRYDKNSDYEAPLFWYIEQPTKELSVEISALKDGNRVSMVNTYTKLNSTEGYMDIEDENFSGGEFITINFTPAQDESGYINGINISATITFDNYDESVTIEVKDEGSEDNPVIPDPSDPDPNTPSTSDEIVVDFVYGQTVNVNYMQTSGFPDVEVDFDFPTGVEHLYVKVSGSPDFTFACSLMGLTDGDGLDLAGDDALDLAELFALPKVGDRKYVFSLNATLWALLCNDPGYPGSQVFTLTAVDKNGATKSGALTININQ